MILNEQLKESIRNFILKKVDLYQIHNCNRDDICQNIIYILEIENKNETFDSNHMINELEKQGLFQSKTKEFVNELKQLITEQNINLEEISIDDIYEYNESDQDEINNDFKRNYDTQSEDSDLGEQNYRRRHSSQNEQNHEQIRKQVKIDDKKVYSNQNNQQQQQQMNNKKNSFFPFQMAPQMNFPLKMNPANMVLPMIPFPFIFPQMIVPPPKDKNPIVEQYDPLQQVQKKPKEKKRDKLYIKNIPDYYNKVELLTKIYQKFGSIENITCDKKTHMATIQFMNELDLVKAKNANKKLFDQDDIFITLDPMEQPPKIDKDEAKKKNEIQDPLKEQIKHKNALFIQQQGKIQNIEKPNKNLIQIRNALLIKITNKLKLIMYLKNREDDETKKQQLQTALMAMKDKKETISKEKSEEKLKEYTNEYLNDFSFESTLIINNLQESHQNHKFLHNFLESFGKIEILKISLKDNSAIVGFYKFESAEKAYQQINQFQVQFQDENLLKYMKIYEVEEKIDQNDQKQDDPQITNNTDN